MGYRENQKEKWLKPVGYHLFSFEESTKNWCNWFQGRTEILLWDQFTFEGADDEFLDFLKQTEANTKTNSFTEMDNNFLTRTQQMELLL